MTSKAEKPLEFSQETAAAMYEALRQITKNADRRLKRNFSGRTDQCAKDYFVCVAAIAKAEGRS